MYIIQQIRKLFRLKIKRINNAKRKRFSPSKKTHLCDSELEEKMFHLLTRCGFQFKQQHKFHPSREWRFDFAFIAHKIAIEIQGFGTGHNSYNGMSNDYEKHNSAILEGWLILYFMAHDLETENHPTTIYTVRTALEQRIPGSGQTNIQSDGRYSSYIEALRRRLDQT